MTFLILWFNNLSDMCRLQKDHQGRWWPDGYRSNTFHRLVRKLSRSLLTAIRSSSLSNQTKYSAKTVLDAVLALEGLQHGIDAQHAVAVLPRLLALGSGSLFDFRTMRTSKKENPFSRLERLSRLCPATVPLLVKLPVARRFSLSYIIEFCILFVIKGRVVKNSLLLFN
jgi:hypothetical protein